jgi:hypothetical protein
MILLTDILKEITEGKQLGTLYHYTDIKNMVKIIPSNKLKGRYKDEQDMFVISFTRNQIFTSQPRQLGGKNLNSRLVIDGNKLSNKYKLSPYAGYGFRRNVDKEQEERLYMENEYLTNLDNYVVHYDFFLEKILDRTYYRIPSLIEYLEFLLNNIQNPKFRFYFKNKELSKQETKEFLDDEYKSIA